MQRYWDLSEKQRAELTEKEVAAMLPMELMEKGVVQPQAPQLLTAEIRMPATRRMYCVSHDNCYGEPAVVYESAEEAELAMGGGMAMRYDYFAGKTYHYVDKSCNMAIKAVDVVTDRVQIAECKTANEKAIANKKINDEALAEYEATMNIVDAVTENVWEDYRACQTRLCRYQRIANTFAEYVTMSDDHEVAAKFLHKAFPASEINAANEWFAFLPACEVVA